MVMIGNISPSLNETPPPTNFIPSNLLNFEEDNFEINSLNPTPIPTAPPRKVSFQDETIETIDSIDSNQNRYRFKNLSNFIKEMTQIKKYVKSVKDMARLILIWYSNKIGGGCHIEEKIKYMERIHDLVLLINELYTMTIEIKKTKNPNFKIKNVFQDNNERYEYLIEDILPELQFIL